VSAQQATEYQLAYVDSSTGHAIIKVDDTSTVSFLLQDVLFSTNKCC
jgi:hypothetical protein